MTKKVSTAEAKATCERIGTRQEAAQNQDTWNQMLMGTIADVDESLCTIEEQLSGIDVLLETVCREYTDEIDRDTMIARVANDPERLHNLTRMMWDYLNTAKDEVKRALFYTSVFDGTEQPGASPLQADKTENEQ